MAVLIGIIPGYSVSFQGSFYDKFIRNLPNKDIKNPKTLTKVGQKLASPHWNRLALGVAAISTQPFFDLNNKKVDRETAVTSSLRTTAKIIACTTVGFIVRGTSYAIANKLIHASEKEGSTLLTPKRILAEKDPEIRKIKVNLHKNTTSTLLAFLVMMFTNFLLDAPLTAYLTNRFNEQSAKNGRIKEVSHG